MKKFIISTVSALLMFGATASAHSYNNSAFMGKWFSANASDTDKTQLYISYMDKNQICVDFKQITDGKELFDFTEYTGNVTNKDDHIEATVKFDYTDEYGTTKSGFMEMAMFIDNIWLSVYSDSGITFYNNAVYSEARPFNPYRSPFSSQFKLKLNDAEQSFGNVKPFIVNGTTYVPLRGVLDAMNINVYWDDITNADVHTQYITTNRNTKILQFARTDNGRGFGPWTLTSWDNARADTYETAAGTADISEHQPIIMNNRSYVPLRVLSECYGAVIDWDDAEKTVLLNDDIASDTKKSESEIDKIQMFTSAKADEIAANYVGMTRYDITPRYTYKSKYYIYSQEGKLFKVFYDGTVSDIVTE
ncbi:MAG: copper amine oxidase N-terminal domain-containing protein [bacterium]|nr:copper amine oxidase N-terminal domain-containing protein [bacterium]